MKIRSGLLIPLLASVGFAAAPSVLVRVTMDEKTPKVGEEHGVTQRIPMKAGEMAVVLSHCDDAYPQAYRRFIPKGTPPAAVNHWIDSGGSGWLLQKKEAKRMKAAPGKGGPAFEFLLRPPDECTLHIAEEEGTLEVLVRCSRPITYFLLMGKTTVTEAKPFAAGQVEHGDPFFESSFQYKTHPYPGKPGKGVIFEMRHPEADQRTDSQEMAIITPAGQMLDISNMLNDNCARAFIGSMSAGEYQVQPRQLSQKGFEIIPRRYELTVREVPDLLALLGLSEVSP